MRGVVLGYGFAGTGWCLMVSVSTTGPKCSLGVVSLTWGFIVAVNRHRRWANLVLRRLRHDLGQMCGWCWRSARAAGGLEFDCIAPEGDEHHRWETNRRAVFYRRLYRRGGLQLLCPRCHRRKTRAQVAAEVAAAEC